MARSDAYFVNTAATTPIPEDSLSITGDKRAALFPYFSILSMTLKILFPVTCYALFT
jgi:hypothetical protein